MKTPLSLPVFKRLTLIINLILFREVTQVIEEKHLIGLLVVLTRPLSSHINFTSQLSRTKTIISLWLDQKRSNRNQGIELRRPI